MAWFSNFQDCKLSDGKANVEWFGWGKWWLRPKGLKDAKPLPIGILHPEDQKLCNNYNERYFGILQPNQNNDISSGLSIGITKRTLDLPADFLPYHLMTI